MPKPTLSSRTERAPATPLRPRGRPGRIVRDRLGALIELLDDESPDVGATVRDELLRTGKPARSALERATHSGSARRRARARSILARLDRLGVLRRLVRHSCRPDIDLESAFFLLSRLDRPQFDSRPYRKALDAMAAEVQRRMRDHNDDFIGPMALPQYLGNDMGLIGAEDDFDHPDNIFLHRGIERRRGMPLTLAAIYLFVARRLGLEAGILPLPGHVLLRLRAGRRSLILDPFHGGRLVTKSECLQYLTQVQRVPRPEWFRDASDAGLFQRQVLNLMSSAQMRGRMTQARELHTLAAQLGQLHAPTLRSGL